jgi:hypothetical protein
MYKEMADAQASLSRPQAAQDPRPVGPRAVANEIQRLSNVGLYAIPVRMFWNKKEGKKDAEFPHKYAHITTPQLWKRSIDKAKEEKKDANGIAILTRPSRIFVVDIDVSSKDGRSPGIQLWNRLVKEHGEPQTLKARSGSGGYHFYFNAATPGLKCTRNFAGIKVDNIECGIDNRAGGGIVFAQPASYVNNQGKLATYEWLNGPASFQACQDMPSWLVKFLNDHVQQTATDETKKHSSCKNDLNATPSIVDKSTSISLAPFEYVQDTEALPGLEGALREIKRLLRDKVQDDTSIFNGIGERTPNGWRILKFRTNGVRTCLNGHQHDSNQFSILSNGCILVYRCLSPGRIDRPKQLLGIYFWPECLPLRVDGELFRTCESYILPFKPSTDEGEEKKRKKEDDEQTRRAKMDLHDLVLRTMNHYFAVVRSTKAVYLETIYSRDANGKLEPEETIHRSGRDFLEVCKNFQLESLSGKSKEVARFWESSSKRREYDQIVFEPDPSKVSSRHFNLFSGLRFKPLDHKLTESELVECEEHMLKLMWHFRNIMCDGSKERFDYNIRWMAHAVQKPWRKIAVALVFRSGQGCGKSVLWDFFGRLILGSKYYLYCNEIEKIIGKFNSLAANRLLVVLDECGSWGGAYRMHDRIKSLITQETAYVWSAKAKTLSAWTTKATSCSPQTIFGLSNKRRTIADTLASKSLMPKWETNNTLMSLWKSWKNLRPHITSSNICPPLTFPTGILKRCQLQFGGRALKNTPAHLTSI